MATYDVMIKVNNTTGKEPVFANPGVIALLNGKNPHEAADKLPSQYVPKAMVIVTYVEAESEAEASSYARQQFDVLSGQASSKGPCRGSFLVKKRKGQTAP